MSFIPGATVGPYRIVEQAERSSVATTYTAYQPTLGRYVSIVVVPAIERDDVSLQRQYRRQLELVLSLRHPNILTVVDHGEHLDVPFVVNEALEAEPLSDRLGAPWSLTEVARVLRPIATALDYAHGLGVVHGDVRPAAVLLTPDGTPILSGFGLMTRPLALPAGSAVGEAGRRPPSAAEEFAQAQPADRRGLARIAYEMLTGRSTDIEPAEIERPLAPAQVGSPLLAAPVERVMLRELTGESSERYPSATAFVDDLSTPVESTRPNGVAPTPAAEATTMVTPPPNGSSADARRRLITVALIFAALALIGALAIVLRGGDAARPIASPARTPGAVTTSVPNGAGGSTAAGASGASAQPKAPSAASAAGQEAAPAGQAAAPAGPAGAPAGQSAGAGQPVATPEGQAPAAPTGSAGSAASSAPTRSAGVITVLVPTPVTSGGAAQPAGTLGPASGQPPAVAQAGAPPAGAAPTPAPTARPATAVPASAGSTRLPATWRAVGDPSGRWALDEQGRVAGRTETGASVLLFPDSVDDIGFSALVSTTSCQATLVFRAQDDENLLMAIYIPDDLPAPGTAGGGVWLYQRVEGLDLPIRAVRPATVRPAGEPVRLKIITSGPNISILLDDQPALQAVDTAPRSGRLGLMVYSTSGRLCEATFGDIER